MKRLRNLSIATIVVVLLIVLSHNIYVMNQFDAKTGRTRAGMRTLGYEMWGDAIESEISELYLKHYPEPADAEWYYFRVDDIAPDILGII